MTISYPTAILDGLGVVALVGGGLVVLLSRSSKENTSASSELIDKLEKLRATDKEEFIKRIGALEEQRDTNIRAIADLQGQIKVIKDMPLQKLADGIEAVAVATASNHALMQNIADSNKEIVAQLKTTATIAAEDRDVLTNSNVHIRSEVHKEIEKMK